MNDDIQQPEEQEGGSTPSAGKKTSKLAPFIALIAVGGIVLTSFVIGLAIAFSFVRWRDPAPNTTAYANGTYCASWDDVLHADQETMIKNAALKYKINPALVAAIFLSENGNRWPSTPATGPWATSPSDAMGPFQFIQSTWDNLKQSGGSPFDGYDVQNFQQAAEVVAFHLGGILDANHWSRQSPTEQQVECMAAAYNKGGAACTYWKDHNYQGDPVPAVDSDAKGPYHIRTWQHYQNLNAGCQSYTAEGYLKIRFLSQRDPEWGTTGGLFFPTSGSIAGGGCAATSAAMVINFLKGTSIKPYEIAEKFYATRPSGYNWAPFSPSVITSYGIKMYINNADLSKDQVDAELKNGHPVIMHMEGSVNPKHASHYVVIKGIRGDDKYITADPITTTDANVEYPIEKSQYKGRTFFSFGS